MPKKDWIAFTISNEEDEELIPSIIKICLDKNVSYTCSAGNFAIMTEEYFDEEIAWRGVDHERKRNKEFNHGLLPITTAHNNFGEGFWFATTLAQNDSFEINKVVCIDFTKKKVRKHLIELIAEINNGWLPSDEEIELARYGNEKSR